MRKLYLLLDEWDNDRNFVGEELKIISDKYEVTVICNSANANLNPQVKYNIYTRPHKLTALGSLARGMFDKELWQELGVAVRYKSEVSSRLAGRISESLRFYINADMFRKYLKRCGCLENGAIYYSYWNFWKCYAVASEIAKYPDSRLISRIHGYELYDEQIPSGYQPFKRAMDKRLSRLIFISEMGKEYYLSKFNRCDSEKYSIYLLGTRSLYDKNAACSDMRTGRTDESSKNKDGLTLVSCSRVDAIKRVDRIARAVALVKNTDIRWIHFGDGELLSEVKETAESLFKDRPEISCEFRGFVENREIHEFYLRNHVDAFITASSSEGNPVSVMEAMSYGIPVIAPAICNFPNMIGDCGILVDEKCEPSDLADAVQRLHSLPEEQLLGLRNNARKCWDDNFNAEKNNKRFVEEVLDCL